ncbi:hypothetical protein DE146DRAFT_292685 [Phaeosphaeria sp. MPI-PUGE-AT-0046c]|nr:hypothetical protein DE146DRAFT_292685 [Phaeosphaeria sp. MPI-PUGE-AT-0046c]
MSTIAHRRRAGGLVGLRPLIGHGNALPQAPRAMNQTSSALLDARLDQLRQYETKKLYPRLVLFEALAAFKHKHKERQHSGDHVCDARRDFLDSFAYLCDTRKGGSTVTAAALQKLPASDFLWLAANEGISDDVFNYAKWLVRRLQTVTNENKVEVQSSIFSQAVAKSRERVQFYKDMVQPLARNCRMQLRDKERDEIVILLRKKLKALSEPDRKVTMEGYIDVCFVMRDAQVGHIKKFSSHPDDDFAKLAHYVWRMGATRSAANTVVDSMRTVPSLYQITEIRLVSASQVEQKILDPTCIFPHEILHGIVTEAASRQPLEIHNAFTRLLELDAPVERPIFNKIAAKTNVITRVHAELQIVDTFSRHRWAFVADDKYIGCSKPACYFCYNWLVEHHYEYVAPKTHHKIIPGCRGPDGSLNEAGAKKILQMYHNIGKQIGQDILEFLGQGGELRRQYMSTQAPSTAVSSAGYV